MRKEDEYIERTNQLKEWRKQRELSELKSLDDKMDRLDKKISKGSSLHEDHIKRIASEAKLRNERLGDKMMRAQNLKNERELSEK